MDYSSCTVGICTTVGLTQQEKANSQETRAMKYQEATVRLSTGPAIPAHLPWFR